MRSPAVERYVAALREWERAHDAHRDAQWAYTDVGHRTEERTRIAAHVARIALLTASHALTDADRATLTTDEVML